MAGPAAAADPAAEGDLRGLIHDADGHPVPGAEVVLIGLAEGNDTTYSCPMPGPIDSHATTGADGRFILRHADPSKTYTVRVSASGFSRTTSCCNPPCWSRAVGARREAARRQASRCISSSTTAASWMTTAR